MAFAIIGTTPGGTAELDTAVAAAAGLATSPPEGAIARLAGPIPGGWRVISVWESRESWERFRTGRLEPAFKSTGQPAANFEEWPLASFRLLGTPV